MLISIVVLNVMLRFFMLARTVMLCCNAEWYCALSAVMISVILLSVTLLSVILLTVILLRVMLCQMLLC